MEIEQLVHDVRFTLVRLRPGYDMGEVDDFLDRVAATARSGGDVRGLLAGARFGSTRWREGYAVDDVDGFLDRLRAALGGHGA